MRLPLIVFDHANIRRPGAPASFHDFTWTIRDGETWAIVGPTGSGKTTLAEAIAGRLHADGLTWPFIDRLDRRVEYPSQVVRLVAFKEESRLFSYSKHYYQQRFNFIEADDDLTLDQFLQAGSPVAEDELVDVCRRLRVDHLRDLSLIKLSNGQTRRARIAKALLRQPEVLIFDDPFMGLDTEGRAKAVEMLESLGKPRGSTLILITRPNAIPDWATHVLELDNLAIRWAGRREDFPRSPSKTPIERGWRSDAEGTALVELNRVNVAYEGRSILRDITWTVRAGERWALLGPNGSGKSTLLSLIAADHPQAYSNEVRLFGRRRGTGESIWDIKRHIGLVSPEMHLYFSEPLTAFRAAATGYFDVLAHRPTTAEQDRGLMDLFEFFGIAAIRDRPFTRLSTGEQRLVLLLRALVKKPALLILDEPFQGLDADHTARLKRHLEERLSPEQALIFVTHLVEEIPRGVDRLLRLHPQGSVPRGSEA
jgi:molybdate transport system ATP-binding protein